MRSLRFPPEIQQHLPASTLSVHKFVTLDLPSYALATTQLARAQNYASELQPTVDNVNKRALLLSPSDNVLTSLQQSICSGMVKSILCPHFPNGDGGQRYPLWLASFWIQLSSIREIQKKWKSAIRNLEVQMNQDKESIPLRQAFNALSHIPWTGRLQGFQDTIELEKLSIYFTQDWLSDDHELVMLSSLKDDLLTAGKEDSFIENTAFMLLLGNAYRDQQAYTTERCYEWLRHRGDELAIGEKRYLSTIANQDNVHWVAIVLDFDQRKILYGDSYEKCISAEHHTIIDWWTEHHVGMCFTIRDLPVRRQVDNFSCGILAWDSLRLHYGLATSSMNLCPFECRATVFLRLTEYYHKDKVSGNIYKMNEDLQATSGHQHEFSDQL
jgi:hypothetical protein